MVSSSHSSRVYLGSKSSDGTDFFVNAGPDAVKSSPLFVTMPSVAASFDVLALRRGEALQRWKEISLNVPQNYRAQIKAHFGVDVGENMSGMSTYVGGDSSSLDISEVVNTNLSSGDVQSEAVIAGIEMFRKLLDEAQPGDNIGALLRGVQRDEIQRGQVLCKPGSITPHHKFTAQVYVLTKDEGGRHTPFFNNYRPQFYFRTTDVTGVCELPAGTEMCMPGDNVEMTVELIHNVAMEQGLRFAIREGGRTVGSGAVATIIE